jgi:hypothetical protein
MDSIPHISAGIRRKTGRSILILAQAVIAFALFGAQFPVAGIIRRPLLFDGGVHSPK